MNKTTKNLAAYIWTSLSAEICPVIQSYVDQTLQVIWQVYNIAANWSIFHVVSN